MESGNIHGETERGLRAVAQFECSCSFGRQLWIGGNAWKGGRCRWVGQQSVESTILRQIRSTNGAGYCSPQRVTTVRFPEQPRGWLYFPPCKIVVLELRAHDEANSVSG